MRYKPRSPRRPHEIPRVSLEFDPAKGRTHQSFKDECDVNRIVETYARTGVMPSVARGEPKYGTAPDQTLFEAALVQAELRSHHEMDALTPSEPPQSTEPEKAPEDTVPAEQSSDGTEKPPEEPSGG